MRKLFLLISLMISTACCCQAQTSFEKRISELGLSEYTNDWSDSADINIPRPKCAYVNLTGFSAIPKKGRPLKGWFEMYDGNGNYFKKRMIIDGQGKTSRKFDKKNFAVDFCNDEWLNDSTPDITIGDWVEQDSYHFKAFWFNYNKGTGIIGYQVYDEMINDRGEYGRMWERAAENIKNPDPRARCFPDAFPCVVYINGDFYGLFCWQLKKNRKNMNLKKNNNEHIHLHGFLGNSSIVYGAIDWEQFEVRNPNNLFDMNGNPYVEGAELMDETSPYYGLETDDKDTRKGKESSAKVKASIRDFSNYYAQLKTLENGGASSEEMRAAIEERYDITSVCDYLIFDVLTNNFDGLYHNYQLFTYDGKKWFLAPYDLDCTFGYFYLGISLPTDYYYYPLSMKRYSNYGLFVWADKYFKTDIRNRYAEIRNSGALTAENIISMFDTWYYDFGEENYRMEYEKWPTSPAVTPDTPNDGWKLYTPYSYSLYAKTPKYSASTEYHEGDLCRAEYRIWEATTTVQGVQPYAKIGCKDSLERMPVWIKKHMEALDSYMKFSFTSQIKSYTLDVSFVGWSTICLPFSFAIPSDMKLYTVKGRTDKGLLDLEEVTSPEANKPYLVKAAPGSYLLTGYTEEGDEYSDDFLVNGLLKGCFSSCYVPSGNYVLQNHNGKMGFYRVSENGKIKMGPNRAYLLSGEEIGGINEYVVDTADGIATLHNEDDDNVIVGIYDANGTKREELRKGVNLVRYSNGKTMKMIIK